MRLVRGSSEAEMVALFLLAELDSPRFGRAIRHQLAADGLDARVLREPDLGDEAENGYRRLLLERTRGYLSREGLFGGFPGDVRWHRGALGRDEVGDVRVIAYDYWEQLSRGTRRLGDVARGIADGVEPFGVSNAGFHELAAAIAAGLSPPPPILVATSPREVLVILEGHGRLSARMLRPETLPDELEVLCGFSPAIAGWALHQLPPSTTSPAPTARAARPRTPP
jgi:hypothetical protein